ncbi:hypothetical protein TCDM_14460 [Trypanosoma cruzi Dm28c]|uniref:Uncharacterized protein n=2 Tax=Trypanosoma cruzi TaxID=5693 RepID=V5DRU6_TRYCR|nr:hypothetical protein TCDM_14460 [Trypanosoma cruzi Dm28c]PBJ72025.1 hypothetical protein BCY84_16099 [Trypanosoma cruzi cruzi]PWU98179.1 hypothetical protein C4B63_13g158 [Trypanosoma cruzi]
MEESPHYSRVADAAESINVVTGRSIYYGMRPWRCDDRFHDLLSSFLNMDSLVVQLHLAGLLWRCSRSRKGSEPIDCYKRLGRGEVMYYVDRYRSGMMRTGYFDKYPYNQNELQRIIEEDGLKMRVWRHQRELEMESKEGKIDDLLRKNVMKNTERFRAD